MIWSILAEGATPTTHLLSGDWEEQDETPRSVEEEEEGCSAPYGVAQRAQLVAELVQKGGEGEGSSEEDEPEAELDANSSVGGGVDGDAWASSGPGAVRGHFVRCSGTSANFVWPQVAEGVTPTTHIFSGDWESQEEPPRSVEVARSAFGAEDGVGATDGYIGVREG